MGRKGWEEISCIAKLETPSHPISQTPSKLKTLENRIHISYSHPSLIFYSCIQKRYSLNCIISYRSCGKTERRLTLTLLNTAGSVPFQLSSSPEEQWFLCKHFNDDAQSVSTMESTSLQQQQAYPSSEVLVSLFEGYFHLRSHSSSGESARDCYLLASHA